MFDLVKRCVDAHLERHGRDAVRTDRVVYLDTTNRGIDGYCYLFFAENDPFPRIVAKAARTARGKEIFEIDFDNLETLQAIGMNAERRTTPAPLGKWHEAGTLVTLQSALPGTLMKNIPGSVLFSPANVERTFDQVIDWWKELQRCFGVRRVGLDDEVYARTVLEPVERFRRRFLLDRDEEDFLRRRYEVERCLSGTDLPFMARHADFAAANMVSRDEGIAVFDWEFPLRHETPLFDLFFFFSSVRFPYSGYRGESSHLDSFVSVHWEDSYFNRAMRRRLGELCASFGIPPEAVPDLLVVSLIQVANMKYDGLIESHGIVEEPANGPRAGDEAKRARWAGFERPDKNAPFATITGGVFENLRCLVRKGLPRYEPVRF